MINLDLHPRSGESVRASYNQDAVSEKCTASRLFDRQPLGRKDKMTSWQTDQSLPRNVCSLRKVQSTSMIDGCPQQHLSSPLALIVFTHNCLSVRFQMSPLLLIRCSRLPPRRRNRPNRVSCRNLCATQLSEAFCPKTIVQNPEEKLLLNENSLKFKYRNFTLEF